MLPPAFVDAGIVETQEEDIIPEMTITDMSAADLQTIAPDLYASIVAEGRRQAGGRRKLGHLR